MAIVITFPGFNYLGLSLTPIFLSMGRFLYRFSTFEENLWIRSFNLLQNAPLNSVHLTSWFSCEEVSKFQRFVKMMAIFEIIKDSLIHVQIIVRIVCLC